MEFKTVFSTPFFVIEAAPEPSAPEHSEPYYRLSGPDSVICCAMTDTGNFVMIKQFRPNVGAFTLEFPAGGISPNESPEDAAGREFAEETSLECRFAYLGAYRLMMNRTNIREHIFFGMNPTATQVGKSEEVIECVYVDRLDLLKYAREGKYEQLAGLGVIQLASLYVGVDILRAPVEEITDKFNSRF